jgi:hypothetical protein
VSRRRQTGRLRVPIGQSRCGHGGEPHAVNEYSLGDNEKRETRNEKQDNELGEMGATLLRPGFDNYKATAQNTAHSAQSTHLASGHLDAGGMSVASSSA